MSVKIFLPEHLFYTKHEHDIFGEIQINENNSVSYYVICTENKSNLRLLGHILSVGSNATNLKLRDVSLSFTFDPETPNIYLNKLSIKPPNATHVNVFLYNARKLLQLCTTMPKDEYDVVFLYHLLQENQSTTAKRRTFSQFVLKGLNFPMELMTQIFIFIMELKPVSMLLHNIAFYKHFREWSKFRSSGKRNVNITFDKILGIYVMLLLLIFLPQPGNYLKRASQFVIGHVRLLINSLKGNPIGLKLNVHLNNFFLDCCDYHIDLWEKSLELIEPIIKKLFLPIALLGSMGLSFQLALFADLISVMGLHAHCFYIYTAVLYRIEIKGLQSLWKVMLGKRYNRLKNRVESHNYINRQLYLATILFTSQLFLFPTILVYYTVFTTVRLCIYLFNLLLIRTRRHILEFPLETLFKYLTRRFYEVESIHMQHLQHEPSPLLEPESTHMEMCVFQINVLSSSLGRVFSCKSGVLKELTSVEHNTLKNIFNGILEGKF
ncbi:phosphatidylinositol N-acetylglucosaminyltransferase subunit Q-like [Teleopsis dalmanni]|uniref:phosphatidylinositol N-acetylglucosaminyltransferase subunit Q-like n=1 Tax=Teleopsis dalmanni TaxID=139649 RepID=UPI0018CE34C2|nr:phosphatidylinositol N-acetylglucosaminyltransferase subunit Q-like [Teleopsis dalmanni]XP_037933809.1 phosphatidylinositol N-acetylglucosaminyltransferase subunit Q-like [Teleopsis dalmanni]